MNPTPAFRFCPMMFLQFFIWGVWYVPMWTFLERLNVESNLRGIAYASTGLAAMISPLIVGMIADRYFATQKVYGLLHLFGGVALLLAGQAEDWNSFYPFLLLHLICYMPTLALSNSVCFQNIKEPKREFPPIRIFGTIGWIASGILVGSSFFADGSYRLVWPVFLGGADPSIQWESIASTSMTFQIAASASFILSLYAFTLPNTPPQLRAEKTSLRDALGLRALNMMKNRSFAVFSFCSLLLCIPLSFYFQSTNGYLKELGIANSEGVMTLGQLSEIFFLLLVPLFFRKLGIKKMLLIGMGCWVCRYALFSQADHQTHAFLYMGVLLHGICYDFFFVTGQLYVDEVAPKEVRSSAQGFLAFVTLGVGMFIGGILNGWWNEIHSVDGIMNWPMIWYFPGVLTILVMIIFVLFFKNVNSNQSPKQV